VVRGAGVGADGAGRGGAGVGVTAVLSANHVATPPCREHAPCLVLAVLYVPSVHCAVASVGRAALAVAEAVGLGAVLGVAGAFVVEGATAAPAAPNHVLTPPCFEHAPRSVLAVVYVPSLHCPEAFFGAAVCAKIGIVNPTHVASTEAETILRTLTFTSREIQRGRRRTVRGSVLHRCCDMRCQVPQPPRARTRWEKAVLPDSGRSLLNVWAIGFDPDRGMTIGGSSAAAAG
jgi:hypothetical protein